METPNPESGQSGLELISQVHYEGDQSAEFDAKMVGGEYLTAYQQHASQPTYDKMLYSSWQTPCHSVLLRADDGECQLLHMQPNKPSHTLLSWEQREALESFAQRNAQAIVAKSGRSWFSVADEQELEEAHVALRKVIPVETSNWWRFLYDPKTNEVWIDAKVERVLSKYRGF